MDGSRASEITFENVEVPADRLIGGADNGLPLIERVTDEAIAATCAEATGAMKVLVDATVEYSKTRKQFGVPIGKFQVLQHRMVDMFVNYEQSVSMTLMVTLKLDESDVASEARPPPPQRCRSARPAASSARARCRCTAAWA